MIHLSNSFGYFFFFFSSKFRLAWKILLNSKGRGSIAIYLSNSFRYFFPFHPQCHLVWMIGKFF